MSPSCGPPSCGPGETDLNCRHTGGDLDVLPKERAELMGDYPYVFYWNRLGRKGQRCKVTARGKLNSCRVEFEDGFVVITSRNAVRKAPS